MTQTNQNKDYSWIDSIIREVTGEFAAQYRLRNEAKEPYTIKLAERAAEDAISKAKAAIQSHIDEHYIGKGEAQFNWICQPKECGAYNPYDARMCRVCGSQRPKLFTESEVEQRCIEARIEVIEGLIDAQDQEVDLDGRPTTPPYHIICGNDREYLECVVLPSFKQQLSTNNKEANNG